MNKPLTEDEMLNMSDDEFMSMESHVPEPEAAPVVEEAAAVVEEESAVAAEEVVVADDDVPGSPPEEPVVDEPNPLATSDDAKSGAEDPMADEPAADAKPAEGGKANKDDPKAEGADDPEKDPKEAAVETVAEAIDFEASYKKMMSFKANGKEVSLKSPEEAVKLMQMGANYTKKLQALQPNLKLLKMLENNGLLDEGKLTYLIDIDKKNPAAIQKLIRESGVDPLEIDTSVEPDYKPGNHQVSDEEIRFNSTLEEVASDPVGKQMIVDINRTWDAQSKELLWSDPDVLRVMTEQKTNGLYDQIHSEVERRKMLGQLSNTPFLHAYKSVGEEMHASGALSQTQPAAEVVTPQPSRVVETRPAQRKPVANNAQARAASTPKAAAKKVVADFNPLSMSDEDFEKNAELARRV